ncbi:MAG TPA: extracellular solute-binding protein [Anaerolineae bacterium]|nr:extracellular solute-binding protein [Anaerolineae bacterium]
MLPEIEFSIQAATAEFIQPLLTEFEAKYHVHVKLRLLTWDAAWGELVKVALYNDGPDISEVGSTWLGDLMSMSALHAFTTEEIVQLGKASRFLPTAWQGCQVSDQPEMWAIPWLVGARLIFFRRDLLLGTGVDEDTAFATAENFERTLHLLEEHHVPTPWLVPTALTHTTLLNAASWVWAAGGDFISPDYKHVLIARHQSLVGLRNYFALGRYIPPALRQIGALQPDTHFLQHADTAVTIGGPWMFNFFTAEARENMGLALPLGAPMLGGSHLVIWKHSRKQDLALKLIQFLTQTSTQVSYARRIGLLPAVVDALNEEPFTTDRLWRAAVQAIKAGRTVPTTRSWGLMEDRLATEFAAVWLDFFDNPTIDLVTLLKRRLEPLAERLDQVLAQA